MINYNRIWSLMLIWNNQMKVNIIKLRRRKMTTSQMLWKDIVTDLKLKLIAKLKVKLI